MSANDNTTVTFTPDQLQNLEADAVTAEAKIQQAGTQTPAVGAWQLMYGDLLKMMKNEGISGPQAYWFQEAGAINADTLSDPAGFFVRDITALGFGTSLSDPKLQGISDTIGENIFIQIENNKEQTGSSFLTLNQQLQADIGAAILQFNLPIGSWGGSFYFWNFQYDPNSSETVAQAIESSTQQTQIFVANNARAMADTIEQFGIATLESQQASRDAFAEGFENLMSSPKSWGIAYNLVRQLAADLGDALTQQFMQWINFGWMSEIFVADGSESMTAGSGADVLFGGQGLGGAGNDTFGGGGGYDSFVFALPASGSATETIDDSTGNGQVAVLDTSGNLSFLGGTESQPLVAVAGDSDTWTDSQGTVYKFDSTTEDLTIANGVLGSGNEVVVDNFDLAAATETAAQGGSENGYLGFHLADGIALTAGATAGVDLPPPDFTAGSSQSYTVSVDAPSGSAQTVTVTLGGPLASDFGLVSGAAILPINSDGAFTVTIPAGETSASFTLANTADVGGNASLQLSASLAYGNSTITSGALTQNFDESSSTDPFSTPATTATLYYFYSEYGRGAGNPQYNIISDDSNFSDSISPSVTSAGSGLDEIDAYGNDEVLQGGTGADLINADFGESNIYYNRLTGLNTFYYAAPGTDEVVGNGGTDFITDTTVGPQTNVEIYADQAMSLASAIEAAQQDTGTDQPGDVISTGVLTVQDPSSAPSQDNPYLDGEPGSTTVVGGIGNDLIVNAEANAEVVAGSGKDTIIGGVWLDGTAEVRNYTGGAWTVASATPDSLVVDNLFPFINFGSDTQLNLNDVYAVVPVAPGYEGNVTTGPAIYNLDTQAWSQSGEYEYGGGNETIFGGAGASTVLLSNGNNYVNLETGNSSVYGGMGNNTIFGGSGNVYVQAGGGNDYIDAGSGNDVLIGRGGDNTVFGGSGEDTIYAGSSGSSGAPQDWATSETGDNYVEGGSGNSVIYGAGGSDTLIAGTGNSSIYGGAGSESITGGSGNDLLKGGSGNDTIDAGGDGSDTLIGQGAGASTTYVYGGDGTDSIQGDAGTDVLYAGDGGTADAPTSVVAGSGDTSVYGGLGTDIIQGGDGADVLYAGDGGTAAAPTSVIAGSGNTTVYGGDGVDSIQGGAGSDVLYAGDGGADGSPTTVMSGTGTATLYGGAGSALLEDAGDGSDLLVAGSGDETLIGVGQDTLVAGSGSDYLVGGPGSTYVFSGDAGADEVVASGSGTLEFSSPISPGDVSLSAGLDSSGAGSLTLDEGDGSIILDGALSGANGIGQVTFDDPQTSSLTQFIQQEASLGNAGPMTVAASNGNLIFDSGNGDVVSGGSGQDTISAWGNDDTLSGGPGGTQIYAQGDDDLVTGGSGDDTLTAGGASDTLIAGSAVDTLLGGGGSTTFDVNNVSDVVEESGSQSNDTIESSVSYVLPTNVETLQLTGSANLSATGNSDAANTLIGNAGSDTLTAGGGDDTLIAGAGIDTLVGAGSDTFVVDNTADVVSESTADAQDTVDSSVSYTLPTNVDVLVLKGTADVVGTGNSDSANEITANAGDDTLIAGSGADTLLAGSGTDTMIAGSGADVLDGSAADTYVLNSGFGNVEIDPSGGGTIQFGPGVALDSLSLGAALDSAGNASLVISSSDGGSATIDGAFSSPTTEFQFAGGAALSMEQLLSDARVSSGTLAGANGNLVLDSEADASIAGGSGNDTVYAVGAGDTVTAGTGNQALIAVGDDEVLVGGTGTDSLYAGAGSVLMVGSAGVTSMYAGAGTDTYQLVQGGTVEIYAGSNEGTGVVSLPQGMSFSDFTAYQSGEDLVLQSLATGTAATIKNYFVGASNANWFIESQADGPELLPNFIDSFGTQGIASYSQDVAALDQSYGAELSSELENLGEEGGSLGSQVEIRGNPFVSEYTFNGVTTQNISVSGATESLPSSEEGTDVEQTQSSSYTITTPEYETETVQGAIYTYTPADIQSALGIPNNGQVALPPGAVLTPVYDGPPDPVTGQPTVSSFVLSMPDATKLVQTGETTQTYTVNTNTDVVTRGFTEYNVTGDGGNDTITASGPFTGTVNTGNGNVYVNLGTTSGNGAGDWISGDYPGTSTPLDPSAVQPGAFIEAGAGNDTLIGTNGDDVIAAGAGFDYLDGGNGADTYLVPLQGYSTEVIADSGDPGPALPGLLTGGTQTDLGGDSWDPNNPDKIFETPGPGQIPLDTLEMPAGITPDDLSYRLFTTPAYPGKEVLQLNYGNSNVLIVFEPPPVYYDNRPVFIEYLFNPITTPAQLGVDLVKFADGTTLTLQDLMQIATPLANNFDPTVTGQTADVASGQSIAASALFTSGDTAGNSLTWYQISNVGGGHFELDGQAEPVGQSFMVSAGQLTDLQYIGGTAGTSDSITVSAFDGAVWSAAATSTVNVTTPDVFTASETDQVVTGSTSGPDTLTGGYGGDTLVGASGQDTFIYNAGSGSEVISESASPSASTSSIQFGSGLQPSAVTLSLAGDPNLVLALGTSGDAVNITGFDPLNPLKSTGIQSFSFADGTNLSLLQLLSDGAVSGGSGSITNADGSTTTYDFTPTDQEVYYAQDVSSSRQVTASFSLNSDGSSVARTYDGQGRELTYDATYADGSTDDVTAMYNSDGTYSQTEVSTPAGGGGSTTTVYGYDSSGDMLSKQATYADGSTDDWTFIYTSGAKSSATEVSTPAGGGGSTTTVYGYDSSGDMLSKQVANPDGSSEDYTYDTQGRELTVDLTNADGSTVDAGFTYSSDGTSSETDVSTPAGGGSSTTTVYQYDAQGNRLSENSYTPAADGSYTDNWEKADGSSGSYWWNASTSEYQESWYDSDGSHWTDDYQYASGGSPDATGYSFVETYSASDGSQGSRQYNASTGAVTLSWDSAATGSLSGTISDSGFIGLQNDGELTNTQQYPTFFNPQVSTSFNAFLAAH